ncbi:phosphatidate cytidylyltransferase [Microcella frigidaquae]|uniref:Phosphatidate cytidylyltransferase n=1 Tax=Microcella frigidaquae TaxID=424758 RepID=A0A840X508_9MICO|nr:phosphatidate cytidylyltransferase [Microcella frigidaquae]MBB5617321.1 phosphatidate cytidylyltransferase [Microcella frigidaquae]MCA1942753.1 phosphatidate cytidylyltransferase [Microcella sp.]NHN45204.1 phosphatidate cytidylyltransferase [Microcella frigidaquae]
MADTENSPERPRRGRAASARDEVEAAIHDIETKVHDLEAKAREIDARIEARAGRNLTKAIFFGLVLGFSLLFSLIVVKELFMLFAGALVAFTVYELASALRFAGRDIPRVPLVAVSLGMVPAAFYGGAAGLWWAYLAAVGIVSLWRIVETVRPAMRQPSVSLRTDLAAGIFVLSYVPLLAGFAVVMTARDGGQWWVLAYLIVVIAIDTGAYASGILFGKHPMAPRISPKKTWEGFAGSVVAATIAGILLAVLMIGAEWWVGLVLALTLVGVATLGDLTESLIKRDLGIKDISTWLPGHGGFLDRLDSMLPATIAAYVIFSLLG